MKGSSWSGFLGFTTFGESHGKAIGIVIEDVKANVVFPIEEIKKELARRRPGRGKFSSARKEDDDLVIISGVFEGKTTGAPICLLVYSLDASPDDYQAIKDFFRPGHADHTWYEKFKIYDYRGGGRASGRETISRVIASALVNKVIEPIEVTAYPIVIGEITAVDNDLSFSKKNELYWPCPETYPSLIDYLQNIRGRGDSVGGIVEILIRNVPAGLGDPVFEKLDANLGKALLSIGGVKGIEFGAGFELGRLKGSEANDEIIRLSETQVKTKAGGIYGGISSGDTINLRIVVKPTPSIALPQKTIDKEGNPQEIKLTGRFDTCIVQRVIPVAEAMIKLVFADSFAYQKQIDGQELGLDELREAIDKVDEDILFAIGRRKKIVEKVGELKKREKMAVRQPGREKELLDGLKAKGEELGISVELIEKLWDAILDDSRKMQ